MRDKHWFPWDGFTQSEAAQAGIDSRTLYRWRDSGKVEQVARGLYRFDSPTVVDLDLIEIAIRVPRATLCLGTALARHGLIDEIPAAIEVATPRGVRPAVLTAPASIHTFDAKSFDVGRSLQPIEGTSMSIGIYSPERCVVDAFRLRGQVGREVAIEALKTWLSRPGSSPAILIEISGQVPRANAPLRTALAHLA
ncbi:type IV toxin-antitoxin system AbiEi family antitoxin domain-containing protein [Promicromonospora soli]